jgi:hypothetical protein
MILSIYKEAFIQYKNNFKYFVISTRINNLISVPIIIIAALSHKQIRINWNIIKSHSFIYGGDFYSLTVSF